MRVPRRNLRPLPLVACRPRGIRRTGQGPRRQDRAALRREAQSAPQHRADLLRRNGSAHLLHGLQGSDHRGRKAHTRMEEPQLRLRRGHSAKAQAPAEKLQAERRHLVPLLQPRMGRISPHSRQIHRLDRIHTRRRADHQPVHEPRDLRRDAEP